MSMHPGETVREHLSAEMALLAAVLYDNESLNRIDCPVQERHFAEPFHGRLWAEMARLIGNGQLAEPIILAQHFAGDPAFKDLGGMVFFADLVEQANPSAVAHYAALVSDQAQRRDLADLGKAIASEALSGAHKASDIIARVEGFTAELARHGAPPEASPIGLGALDMLEAAWDGRYAGTSVGLDCLDRITGGIQPDHVWIVGGRTSMGKSVLLPVLGRGLAEQGRGVLMFSLEMPKREVQARICAEIAYTKDAAYEDGNIKFGDLLKGRGSNHQRERARDAAKRMASLPFTIVDRGGLTLDDIIVQALRQMRAWEKAGVKPGAVLIDHLGLVRSQVSRDSKAAESADTIDRLKEAAKRIGAPIIAAAQVNRNCESRQDKRPTLADFNWSGSIEQIADLACLLYREAYYLERSPSEEDQREAQFHQNDLELIIPKNRSGPTTVLQTFVDVACNVIRDKDERYPADYRGRA